MTLINSRKEVLEREFKGPLIKGKTSRALALIANLFREQGIVKNAKDSKDIKAAQSDDGADVPVSDELVADHEWESLVQPFDPEAGEMHAGAHAEEEDLWEKLSSTRWLKAAAPEVRTATPTSETAAMDAQGEDLEAETEA